MPSWDLPISDPVLKFLIILLIILFAPIVLNRFKVPPILGLIIAGAVIGPHGFNIVARDSSIILSGTAGLLYILFLAGLEIDMKDFKKNSWKSLLFGIYTFTIPMALGIGAGYYIFGYNMLTSVLLASMLASHTLITYVIVSKMGLSKDPSVSITVGGTMITDTLSLLVLTVVVEMNSGAVTRAFWIRLGVSMLVFILLVLFLFPPLCRWFFKRVHDGISQYIFVLSLLFLGAFLAELAGMEGILGSFMVGLALNRLIPRNSPLMSRIDFLGNAIFIPFFLLSVGMLVDYRAFYTSFDTILVGVVMTAVAIFSKYVAATLTQKTFRFSNAQRDVIFGLSNSQAAATLAAVMVGYQVGILNGDVLNGTILMILVTCTVASFWTQKGVRSLAEASVAASDTQRKPKAGQQKMLVAVGSDRSVEELVNLGIYLTRRVNHPESLNVLRINHGVNAEEVDVKRSRLLMDKAAEVASAAGISVNEIVRYDMNIDGAISGVVKELEITDAIVGQSLDRKITAADLRRLSRGILMNAGVGVYVYRPGQPIATVKKHIVVLPDMAEIEDGMAPFMEQMNQLSNNTGLRIVFYVTDRTENVLSRKYRKVTGFEFVAVEETMGTELISTIVSKLKSNEMIWVMLSRRNGLTFQPYMNSVAEVLENVRPDSNYVLVYPAQNCVLESTRYLT